MTDRALMRRALDALSASVPTHDGFLNHSDTIAALRERLARSEQEPLTDEEIADLWDGHVVPVFGKNGVNPIVFARAVERAHGIGGKADGPVR